MTARPRLSAFILAAIPAFSLWFGLILFREEGRITGRRGSVRNKSAPKIELASYLSTKKPFTSSLQRTNLAHSPLKLWQQFLALRMEAGTCKRQLQPPKQVGEVTHPASSGWSYPSRAFSQGVNAILPGALQTLRDQIWLRCLRINFWTLNHEVKSPSSVETQKQHASLQAPKHRRR